MSLKASLHCLVWILISFNVMAHEGRPVYIEVKHLSDQQYELNWKIPPVLTHQQVPIIQLSRKHCDQQIISHVPKLIDHQRYQCRAVDNVQLEIIYPNGNPALSTFLKYTDRDGNETHQYLSPEQWQVSLMELDPDQVSTWAYLPSGIHHIFAGWDHLLFVMCLLFLCRSRKQLILTLTGLTLAHTVTLGLASMKWVTPPVIIIEAMIALSIVYLAAEVLQRHTTTQETWLGKYPVFVSSLFGLIHGFGFANVLLAFGLPQQDTVWALFMFNIGVELGQLMFVGLCLLAGWMGHQGLRMIPERLGFSAGSSIKLGMYAVGSISAFWFVERLSLPFAVL